MNRITRSNKQILEKFSDTEIEEIRRTLEYLQEYVVQSSLKNMISLRKEVTALLVCITVLQKQRVRERMLNDKNASRILPLTPNNFSSTTIALQDNQSIGIGTDPVQHVENYNYFLVTDFNFVEAGEMAPLQTEIIDRDGQAYIRNANPNQNNTYVNGMLIGAEFKQLMPRDIINFGSSESEFTFHRE